MAIAGAAGTQALAGGEGAAGTLELTPLTPARRIRLIAEMAILYVAAPVAMAYAVHVLRVPLFQALLPVLGVCVGLLVADRTFSLRREINRGVPAREIAAILATLVVLGAGVTLYTQQAYPYWFLSLPRDRPQLWALILVLYPVMSVGAQELLYRTLYYHRYRGLFGDAAWLAIAVNGVLFGFGHVIMMNTFAVLSTIAAGALFCWRYERTRSFWAVFLEHTLWGALVFTVGLGMFFFTGVSNARW